MSDVVAGAQLQRIGEDADGFLLPPFPLEKRGSQIIQRFGVLGAQRDGLAMTGDRILDLPLLLEHRSEIAPDFRRPHVVLQLDAEAGFRLLQSLEVLQHGADLVDRAGPTADETEEVAEKIDVGRAIVSAVCIVSAEKTRRRGERRVELANRVVAALERQLAERAIDAGYGEMGGRLGKKSECLERFSFLAGQILNGSELETGLRVVRITHQFALEHLGGLIGPHPGGSHRRHRLCFMRKPLAGTGFCARSPRRGPVFSTFTPSAIA